MSEPLEHHIAFYRFTPVADVAGVARAVRALTRAVLGQVVVAHDGINGAVAGSAADLDRLERDLRGHALLGALFPDLSFQRTACRTRAYARLRVHERRELLPLGEPLGEPPGGPPGPAAPAADGQAFGGPGAAPPSATAAAPVRALDPQAWNRLIASVDVVLIDNRNSFEHRLGRFRGAVDPGVSHFRDMATYLRANAAAWQRDARRVAMYCTGGIRCDRVAGWFDQIGVPLHQPAGGILGYLAQLADAPSRWEGRCFVFDNRIALDARLQQSDTTPLEVYGALPGERWRLDRARRLAHAAAPPP